MGQWRATGRYSLLVRYSCVTRCRSPSPASGQRQRPGSGQRMSQQYAPALRTSDQQRGGGAKRLATRARGAAASPATDPIPGHAADRLCPLGLAPAPSRRRVVALLHLHSLSTRFWAPIPNATSGSGAHATCTAGVQHPHTQ
jgi:hypothetical protein